MDKKRYLTGITTTGTPHLGNYIGAIKPAIDAMSNSQDDFFYFLADYHGIIKCHEPQKISQSTLEIAATWLACGLNPEIAYFYRQSDVPEIMELTWVLNCLCPKGLMNRSHAYKAAVAENEKKTTEELDDGITMGLFSYPVLMSSDILIFNSTNIPVGKDQIQHVEMARDIAQKFNHTFKEIFKLPKAVVSEDLDVFKGLDGRKMSKSYHNTIPLFEPEKKLRKLIMKIQTNSLPPEAPKDTKGCTLYHMYRSFATQQEIEELTKRYQAGIGWGEMKTLLFEKINEQLSEKREHYNALISTPKQLEDILQAGKEKVAPLAKSLLAEVRDAVGIKPLK